MERFETLESIEQDDIFHDVEDDFDFQHGVDDEEEEDDVFHDVEYEIDSQDVIEDDEEEADVFHDVEEDIDSQHVAEHEEDDVFHDVEVDIDSQHGNPCSSYTKKYDEEEDDIFHDFEDDIDSQQDNPFSFYTTKLVEDYVEEDYVFHDVESDFSADFADFDSPSPAKNTGNKCDGGDEVSDILNNLSSKLEFLSTEKGKSPIKQPSSSFDSFIKENINEHTLEEISECINVEKSFSFASNLSNSSPKAHASRKDYISDGYVMTETRKSVSMESFIRIQKNQNVKHECEDDDCVVTSGQNFVPKVKDRLGKLGQESDDSSVVYTLIDESCDSTSEDGVPFSFSNSKLSFSLPSEIANKLYPHHLEGLKWLWSLHCKGKGGILGDDTGLGKTMQICGFLAGLFHSNLIKRVLVVAPKRLIPHWMKELGVVNLSGKTREYFGRCTKARQYGLRYILQDKGVILTTYDIVRKNVKALSGDYDETKEDALTWDYLILDQGHLIKNPSTQRAKSLCAIPCAHRIIISGIPLQNNLKELWALFNFCCPELLGDKKCFKDKYESAILRGNHKKASDRDKRIASDVAQDLDNCIQPYFLCRLKNEVFREDGGTNTAKLSKKIPGISHHNLLVSRTASVPAVETGEVTRISQSTNDIYPATKVYSCRKKGHNTGPETPLEQFDPFGTSQELEGSSGVVEAEYTGK
ncbi:hypothetical protein SSX86_025657 [Deinandra increscens subsp. villosa]|uniref:Helicase ATP-binding domain-containing protein n=1 Tax=Deinandra increscens subsp. villosa TaxID=3103831 RepID=A0AAP0CJL5_9ASTR